MRIMYCLQQKEKDMIEHHEILNFLPGVIVLCYPSFYPKQTNDNFYLLRYWISPTPFFPRGRSRYILSYRCSDQYEEKKTFKLEREVSKIEISKCSQATTSVPILTMKRKEEERQKERILPRRRTTEPFQLTTIPTYYLQLTVVQLLCLIVIGFSVLFTSHQWLSTRTNFKALGWGLPGYPA